MQKLAFEKNNAAKSNILKPYYSHFRDVLPSQEEAAKKPMDTSLLTSFKPSAAIPRKMDVLLRPEDCTALLDSENDFLATLADHPNVGTLVVFNLNETDRMVLLARAMLLGVRVRFCENEDELMVLQNKRRARIAFETLSH